MELQESSCYPTGCPGPNDCIDFPENPANGQVECVVIDSLGTQKCWVYDKCIPGWRAQGTSPSPIQYRGGIDLTTTPLSQYSDLRAGDIFIVTVDADASTPVNYRGLTADISVGERVIFSGSDWQVVSPDLPYASDALLETPDPDNRTAGIVTLASAEEASDCDEKCHVLTPFALCKGPFGIDTITLEVPTTIKQCPGIANVSVKAQAFNEQGAELQGTYTFQWQRRTSGVWNDLPEWDGVSDQTPNYDGTRESTLQINGFNTSGVFPMFDDEGFNGPAPATVGIPWELRVKVTFTNLFGDTEEVISNVITLDEFPTLTITGQPQALDLSSATSGTVGITVSVNDTDYLIADNPDAWTFVWYVDGVIISSTNQLAARGITFNNFDTPTLTITRNGNTEKPNLTLQCLVTLEGNCNNSISDSVIVTLPGSSSTPVQPPIQAQTQHWMNAEFSASCVRRNYSGYITWQRIAGPYNPATPNVNPPYFQTPLAGQAGQAGHINIGSFTVGKGAIYKITYPNGVGSVINGTSNAIYWNGTCQVRLFTVKSDLSGGNVTGGGPGLFYSSVGGFSGGLYYAWV